MDPSIGPDFGIINYQCGGSDYWPATHVIYKTIVNTIDANTRHQTQNILNRN